jgi:hypothetical protein
MAGLTFDTGALLALERRRQRMRRVFAVAVRDDVRITVPAPVILEWWRGRTDLRDEILASVDVEPLDTGLAQLAGEAQAAVRGATAVDSAVMASASRRGDLVYTSDLEDLLRLQAFFPAVRVLSV